MTGLSDDTDRWNGSAESIAYRPGKGVFLALLCVTALVVVFAGFVFWYIPTVGLRSIHPSLPWVLGAALITVAAFVLGGFAWGFWQGGIDVGADLLLQWALTTGILGAIGCAIAGGHPLSILVAFLASPQADYVTGTTMHVNGGMYMS